MFNFFFYGFVIQVIIRELIDVYMIVLQFISIQMSWMNDIFKQIYAFFFIGIYLHLHLSFSRLKLWGISRDPLTIVLHCSLLPWTESFSMAGPSSLKCRLPIAFLLCLYFFLVLFHVGRSLRALRNLWDQHVILTPSYQVILFRISWFLT